MHIGIDATFLPRDHRGMGMVLRNFLQGWQNLKPDKEHKLTFLTFKPKLLEGIKAECAGLGDCLTFAQAPGDLDVCWYPWDRVDVLMPCARVLTMHDALLWEEDLGRKKYRDWPKIMPQLDRVATVSQFVKDRLLKTLGDPQNKAVVCHNPVNEAYLKSSQRPELFSEAKRREFLAKYTDSQPFVLFVGNAAEKRKNLLGLMKAVMKLGADYPHKILAVGPKPDLKIPFLKKLFPDAESEYRRELGELLRERPQLVCFSGEIPLTELMAYCYCDAFAACSSHETFFLPLIEAMACSALCISSRDACLCETGGDVPLYYDPNTPENMAEALGRALQLTQTKDAAEKIREAGRARAALFSPTLHARNMLKIFGEAVEAHKKQA